MISTKVMDYYLLNYVSLISVSIAFILSTVLPPVRSSIYFHREQPVVDPALENIQNPPIDEGASTTRLYNQETNFFQVLKYLF